MVTGRLQACLHSGRRLRVRRPRGAGRREWPPPDRPRWVHARLGAIGTSNRLHLPGGQGRPAAGPRRNRPGGRERSGAAHRRPRRLAARVVSRRVQSSPSCGTTCTTKRISSRSIRTEARSGKSCRGRSRSGTLPGSGGTGSRSTAGASGPCRRRAQGYGGSPPECHRLSRRTARESRTSAAGRSRSWASPVAGSEPSSESLGSTSTMGPSGSRAGDLRSRRRPPAGTTTTSGSPMREEVACASSRTRPSTKASPCGRRTTRRLAFVRSKSLARFGSIWVSDARAANARRIAFGGSPSWSPDGRRLAFSSRRVIYSLARRRRTSAARGLGGEPVVVAPRAEDRLRA